MSKKNVYVVWSHGGEWSNDDRCSGGVAGVYSTLELAVAGIRKMMIDEFCLGDVEDRPSVEEISEYSFEKLENYWSDSFETSPYTIYKSSVDNKQALSVEAAEDTFIKPYHIYKADK